MRKFGAVVIACTLVLLAITCAVVPPYLFVSKYRGWDVVAEQKVVEVEATPVPVSAMSEEPRLPHFGVFDGYGTIPEVTFYADEDSATVAAVAKINYAGEIFTVRVPPLQREGEFCFSKNFKAERGTGYTATLLSLSATK